MATLPTLQCEPPSPPLIGSRLQRGSASEISKRAASRNAGADHTHTFCSPPNQHHVAERVGAWWEVPGELPVDVPVPPHFPRSHAGWHKPPLVEF